MNQNEISQHGILDILTANIKKHRNTIIGVLVVIVAAVACYGAYQGARYNKLQKTWGDLFLADLAFATAANHPLEDIETFAAKNSGTDAGAYAEFTLANAYYQAKDYSAAEKHYKQVMAGPNKNMAALGEVSLIAAQVAAKSYDAAIAQADSFAAKNPAHFALGQVKLHKALAQELSGKKEQSAEAYKQLAVDYPNSYYAAFAQMRLDGFK